MKTYVAGYEHDGRAWVVQFDDPDISTFGRTLSSAKRYARELLRAFLEVDDLEAAEVEIVDRVQLPPTVGLELEQLGEMRAQSDGLRAKVAEETRRAVVDLRRVGLSTRDVGEILGISGARVAQIERETTPA